eukprot:TRINITY_DN8069_c0_g1_i1.p1 TRINITY_DN8069_c0_g1~~TRINITY_DN8069_c0_g1_i1.p1  ORF type:complete len:123 (-),score=15.50 TRINITY_DN8069_c0_g1_i1:380-748(-)
MSCFISFGFDAQITNDFHNFRNNNPELTSGTAINKFWYFIHGVPHFFFDYNSNVVNKLQLVVDGISVQMPPYIESLQVFNIHSSADGVDFLELDKQAKQMSFKHFKLHLWVISCWKLLELQV